MLRESSRRRRRVWCLAGWAVALLALCLSQPMVLAKGSSSSKSAVQKRNSALHKKGSSSSHKAGGGGKKKKKAAKKRARYEDEDDEVDDALGGTVAPYYRPRRKRPAGPSVWQRAWPQVQKAAQQALTTGKQAAERAKVLGAEAATKAQEASRLAKAYYSSEYEKFLLTATWPSDQRIPPHLTKRLVESVARFPARPHSLPEDDPYRVTLRKLWKKMIEKDWRTGLKALTLVHALSRATPLKNSRALSRTLKTMLADVDPKTGHKYFNRRDLVAAKKDDARARLVDAYNGFVLRRALLFAGRFEDVAAPKAVCDTPAKAAALAAKRAGNALLVLDHAVLFIESALPSGTKVADTHLVVVGCLELVVADINDAFALATEQLKPLAALNDDGDREVADAQLPRSTCDDVHRALEKYAALLPKLAKATKLALKTLRFFDLKAHVDLKRALEPAALQASLDKWAALAANAPQDEEDDDDLDDDDEDDEDEDEDFDEEEDDYEGDEDDDDDEDDEDD